MAMDLNLQQAGVFLDTHSRLAFGFDADWSFCIQSRIILEPE